MKRQTALVILACGLLAAACGGNGGGDIGSADLPRGDARGWEVVDERGTDGAGKPCNSEGRCDEGFACNGSTNQCETCEASCQREGSECGTPKNWLSDFTCDEYCDCVCGSCSAGEVCARIAGSRKCLPEEEACLSPHGSFDANYYEGCPDGQGCTENGCVPCEESCEGKECGDNGCGVSCGECEEHHVCQQGQCVYQPWCGDGVCDKDPFEDCLSCPFDCACGAGSVCVDGTCCAQQCSGKECGPDGCGGVCGVCEANAVCTIDAKCLCIPDCKGKECGDDGCGCSCGECPGQQDQCIDNTCVCLPEVEVCNGIDDDCDGETDEGLGTTTCGLGPCEHTVANCSEGHSVKCDPLEGAAPDLCDVEGNGVDDDCDGQVDEGCACVPNCAGKECGSDGCAGECKDLCNHDCPGPVEGCYNYKCVATCIPMCEGKGCGDDGCGCPCGTCPEGKKCNESGTCE